MFRVRLARGIPKRATGLTPTRVATSRNSQPGSPHGRCATKPRSAGGFYVRRQRHMKFFSTTKKEAQP